VNFLASNPSSYYSQISKPLLTRSLLCKVLRIIVTPNCNNKCFYCHNEGMTQETQSLLNLRDYHFLAHSLTGFFDGVAIAGGEPLLSNDLISVSKSFFDALGCKLYLTTNARLPLDIIVRNAELFQRVHITLNSVYASTYSLITGKCLKDQIFTNVDILVRSAIPCMVNTVLINGINTTENEIKAMMDFSKRTKVPLEFLHLQQCESLKGI